MKYKIAAFSIFILGFLYYTLFVLDLNNDTALDCINDKFAKVDYSKIQAVSFDIDFVNIFINNLIVALFLSILGFFSGGVLTTAILFWNGFLFAAVFILGFYGLSIDTLLYVCKHAPIELYALFLFSEFGLKGASFYKKVLIQKAIDFKLFPNIKTLLLPTLLLLIASIIETL
ncbi:stage II sporulation protein M [Pontimicrobium sp. MEBiC06410]